MFTSPGAVAFQIGPVRVFWYGILIGSAIAAAYTYVHFEVRRRNLNMKPIEDMAFWLVLAGAVGARLYYVIFNASHFFKNPLEILKVWRGGLAIHGALIGGAIAYFIYTGIKKISWVIYADCIMPGILLAQAIGRWGNFFNSEAFGGPTFLPWKLFIPEANRPQQFADFSYFHPTFLYESLWNLIGFAILVFLSRRKWVGGKKTPNGVVFSVYLIWYSIGRFFVEGLRLDSLYFGSFRAAQLASILLFCVGIFLLRFFIGGNTIKYTSKV